jgi:hypothetical protein
MCSCPDHHPPRTSLSPPEHIYSYSSISRSTCHHYSTSLAPLPAPTHHHGHRPLRPTAHAEPWGCTLTLHLHPTPAHALRRPLPKRRLEPPRPVAPPLVERRPRTPPRNQPRRPCRRPQPQRPSTNTARLWRLVRRAVQAARLGVGARPLVQGRECQGAQQPQVDQAGLERPCAAPQPAPCAPTIRISPPSRAVRLVALRQRKRPHRLG